MMLRLWKLPFSVLKISEKSNIMEKKDLIIIGTGPGGYDVAVKAAKAGLQIVIFEKQHSAKMLNF